VRLMNDPMMLRASRLRGRRTSAEDTIAGGNTSLMGIVVPHNSDPEYGESPCPTSATQAGPIRGDDEGRRG
jgi:hypothetical protein